MEPLYPGRIVWAVAPGARGGGKKRPMIVTTRRTDILRGKPIVVVVCSTDFVEPLDPVEIRLPSDPGGRCVTRLKEETVAVCDWIVSFHADEIQETSGFVPSALLRAICSAAGIPVPSER